MVKRYVPIFLTIMAFSGFLFFQILSDLIGVSARTQTDDEKKAIFLESSLNTVFLKNHESELKSKVLVVNFWASWCQPCIEELPSLKILHEKLKSKGLTVLGVNADEESSKHKALKLIDKFGIKYSNFFDDNGKALSTFGIETLPVTIIYRNKKFVKLLKGATDFESEEMLMYFEDQLKD